LVSVFIRSASGVTVSVTTVTFREIAAKFTEKVKVELRKIDK